MPTCPICGSPGRLFYSGEVWHVHCWADPVNHNEPYEPQEGTR